MEGCSQEVLRLAELTVFASAVAVAAGYCRFQSAASSHANAPWGARLCVCGTASDTWAFSRRTFCALVSHCTSIHNTPSPSCYEMPRQEMRPMDCILHFWCFIISWVVFLKKPGVLLPPDAPPYTGGAPPIKTSSVILKRCSGSGSGFDFLKRWERVNPKAHIQK